MRAKSLAGLLKRGDRVAVSNITGREAATVSAISQGYCGNIVGGWALGKGGQQLDTPAGPIPVYATFEELLDMAAPTHQPNKIIIYSPPEAVYGEIKEVVEYGKETVNTIFVITEHVAIEVTAKIHHLCHEANIDVIGCNTLGMINVHDQMRVGAVGGSTPGESFVPGSVTVISNSGNMVNTIASYLRGAGMGTAFGISTGKDVLILTPMKDLLKLAMRDKSTQIIVLYVEPGGAYEHEALAMLQRARTCKPIVVYVAGQIAEKHNITLGHAGAVVEGHTASASAKAAAFDEYFGIEPFDAGKRCGRSVELSAALERGIRVRALHHIPDAVKLIASTLKLKRDLPSPQPMRLNPWFVDLGDLGTRLPADLALAPGTIPSLYREQVEAQTRVKIGGGVGRQSMRQTSHASANDGRTPRIYGYSLPEMMAKRSLAAALILSWTGELPRDAFEERLAEMTLIASLTNGPGTISAQGSKLSASAGNAPNTAMIATLASIGTVHGGNGARAVQFLLDVFSEAEIDDPYGTQADPLPLAQEQAELFRKRKLAAKDAGIEYERIPCLGHPVFHSAAVNRDPREKAIRDFIQSEGRTNVFLEFYHHLAQALRDNGCTKNVMAVNVDAAIACIWLGICWPHLREKRMTLQRAMDIPFVVFALGRSAGGASEFLDHQDHGTSMDMRIPVEECRALTRPRKLP